MTPNQSWIKRMSNWLRRLVGVPEPPPRQQTEEASGELRQALTEAKVAVRKAERVERDSDEVFAALTAASEALQSFRHEPNRRR